METKSFETYISTIRKLREELPKFKKQVADTPSIDKYGYGWNTDSRFISSLDLRVFFSSHRGYYGNSSCYTAIDLGDEDLLKEAFLAYLGAHTQEIFDWMADRLEAQSESARVAKIAQMKKELAELESLGGVKEN